MIKLLFLFAVSISSAYADEAEIKSALQNRVPQIGQIKQVSKASVPGLYEVVTQDHLFYTDAKANFLLKANRFFKEFDVIH